MSESKIFGLHAVKEALETQQHLDKLFIQKGTSNPGLKEIEQLANKANVQISYVPIEKLNKLSKNGNHQGVIANSSPISLIEIEQLVEKAFDVTPTPIFILLDQISDVRNLGAIIRTAEAINAQGIILPKQGTAAINEQTVKTSTGAIFNIPICKVDHLKDALFFLNSYDVKSIAASEKTNQLIYDIDFKIPVALIMGSEGKGVSSGLLKMVDYKAKLPMLGSTDSLNVSVACGAILYEIVRQRL
ncbi:23S rRNA (guanosine(2251)-2'-O)-methyltransferase RlmB [Mesonia sp. K4-1]|uniref:23S rRNA (guanosine(2251)-2'-O)-methyltransferase RlmB n=1 Tax=Mesonia sp. K4-1 TaxID=2602760 RepID=UPI0011C884D1|nr:23S rRNA (guanosine(2251)-2'-O)-methyltransferase RlmB [Mesonia sp. K4-1]TXK72154.1 23S rRNA (guanosine(2251)-2'-O)-methyltransferase RlmB [Mesonia sp. K4-1]